VAPDVCNVNICIQAENVYDVNMDQISSPHKGAYHHGNLREALIEAGLAVLDNAKAEDLSLRALAREVGVTANAAYRHFQDKDDLLNALAAEGFRRFAAQQRLAVAQHTETTARLQASGRAYITFAMGQAPLFKLMFSRLQHIGGHAELAQASNDAIAVLLESAAQQAGSKPGDEGALVMAAACWATVHGLSELAMGGQLQFFGMPVPALIDKVMSMPMSPKSCG
jgi:AcrR family transcriptional regulator